MFSPAKIRKELFLIIFEFDTKIFVVVTQPYRMSGKIYKADLDYFKDENRYNLALGDPSDYCIPG